MDEKKYMDMIQPVAKQMCILAGLNPDEIVYVPRIDTILRHEKMRMAQTEFRERMVWAPKPSFNQNEMILEKVMMPSYRSFQGDDTVSVPMWITFRAAAFDCILAHYAVNQVIMTGKEIPL